MMGGLLRRASLGLLAAAALLLAEPSHAEDTAITIGTGGITGVYYPAGGAICRLVNKERDRHGIRCSVESTGGSVYNVQALREGALALGVVQSDVQYNALHGEGPDFKGQGPFSKLRAVLALHPEPFTVVARADAGIATFDDLKGKRVNIGNPGSGQRLTMEVLMAAKGWSLADLALAAELKSAEQSQALADNKLDAVVFTVGHPNGSVQEASTAIDARLVPVNGAAVDRLLAEHSYYGRTVIPGGMYRGTDQDVATFGVRATLVSSAAVPAPVIYEVVKAVFEHFDDFRGLHPAFASLTKAEMAKAAQSAPLHPGAETYYKEAGLL
jgi:hypothetical protein